MKKLEIACFNHVSAQKAITSLADRIELCKNLEAGGTTPDVDFFKSLKKEAKMPIYVMIRPRGGNFVYSEAEVNEMKNSIKDFLNAGADGFVFGLLTKNKAIDKKNCEQLLQLAKDKPCTFHRAIDHTHHYFKSIENLIELGFATLLSSGNSSSAEKGLTHLKNAQNKYGNKIKIMPGGGVRSTNLHQIIQETNCEWFHSSAIKQGQIVSLDEINALKQVINSI